MDGEGRGVPNACSAEGDGAIVVQGIDLLLKCADLIREVRRIEQDLPVGKVLVVTGQRVIVVIPTVRVRAVMERIYQRNRIGRDVKISHRAEISSVRVLSEEP